MYFLNFDKFKEKIIPLLLSCLILSLFAGFRDKNIGSDTDFYPHWYISEIRYIHNLIDLITIETERNLDKGYLFLYWIASWIGNQYWIGLFLTELVISVFTFLGFIRLSRYFKGGIAIFTMAFLLLVLTIRLMLCVRNVPSLYVFCIFIFVGKEMDSLFMLDFCRMYFSFKCNYNFSSSFLNDDFLYI